MLIRELDFNGFVAGSEKSFETIFRQYYRTLVSFSMRYGLQQMEAEDIVIEVIHRIWEIRRELKSPAALHSLFFMAVRNRTINVLRNVKKRERIMDHWKKEEDDRFYNYLVEEEVSRLLYEAVENLPGQCRQVVLLLIDGKSMVEIAGQLNISVSSVKTYKSRAIEILKGAFLNRPDLLFIMILKLNPCYDLAEVDRSLN